MKLNYILRCCNLQHLQNVHWITIHILKYFHQGVATYQLGNIIKSLLMSPKLSFQVMGGDDETFGDARDGWVTPAGDLQATTRFAPRGCRRKKTKGPVFLVGSLSRKSQGGVQNILERQRMNMLLNWRQSGFSTWRKIPEAVQLSEEVVRFSMERLGQWKSKNIWRMEDLTTWG